MVLLSGPPDFFKFFTSGRHLSEHQCFSLQNFAFDYLFLCPNEWNLSTQQLANVYSTSRRGTHSSKVAIYGSAAGDAHTARDARRRLRRNASDPSRRQGPKSKIYIVIVIVVIVIAIIWWRNQFRATWYHFRKTNYGVVVGEASDLYASLLYDCRYSWLSTCSKYHRLYQNHENV